MRTIERTTRFKRNCKREAEGRHRITLDQDLLNAVSLFAENADLPTSHRDPAPTGDWQDHRDRHIKPDLILTYRKPDPQNLQLARLGSHRELSL